MNTPQEYILELQNVSKQYKNSSKGIKNISLALPYGSIMGFVGANGAGKTTSINCILNVIKKDCGSIKTFGIERSAEDLTVKEKIGVVYDSGNYWEGLTPSRLSKVMNGIYKNWNHQRYIEELASLNIDITQKIGHFSKGMKMKLSIATALAHDPQLLILDEPTSGLDPVIRDEMLDKFLDFVQDERKSILLSSHITTGLETIADYITFINDGEILLTALKDDLLYNYGIAKCHHDQVPQIDRQSIVASLKKRLSYRSLS